MAHICAAFSALQPVASPCWYADNVLNALIASGGALLQVVRRTCSSESAPQIVDLTSYTAKEKHVSQQRLCYQPD
jgi:hypothetical protein